MLLSRCARLVRSAYHIKQGKNALVNLNPVRLSHEYHYRHVPKLDTFHVVLTEVMGGIFWWWIFWNFWHDVKHLYVGEAPVPEHWTDKELGIPSDDE